MAPAITLLSDFGPGPYVAQMKGILASLAPDARVLDLTHDVPSHGILEGAYLLWAAAPYFPPGTIHCAVVDPGVGTARRGLVVECQRGLLVGPDNGLLMPAAQALGPVVGYEIRNPTLVAPRPSRTFHGRDIFAPVAAHLARGVRPSDVGPRVADPVALDLFNAAWAGTGKEAHIEARVLHADRFGNLVTNVRADLLSRIGYRPAEDAEAAPRLEVAAGKNRVVAPLLSTYGLAKPGQVLVTVGGAGLLEVAVREGSAAKELAAGPSTELRLRAA